MAYAESSDQPLRPVLEGILGYQFTTGNRIEPLRNGEEIFPPMLEAIQSARSRIEFLTFVYWSGDIAERFAKALAERARAGVVVRVLLDALGAREISEHLVDEMRTAGVNIQWFRPLKRWRLWQLDNRTHRKVLVVDGRIGFTGGVGIAREWEGNARNPDEWRDTHFRVTGPAVQGLQGAFYGNWAETGQRLYHPPNDLPLPESQGQSLAQVVRTTASTGWSDMATLIELVIATAERRLRIASAYFVPDEATAEHLCEAVNRGVEIDIMMPGSHTDERVSQVAGESEFERLLQGGVRLWKYERTMLHLKVMTVDGYAVCIGSANFNQRSMRKDDELALVVLDPELTDALDRHFEHDLEFCERIGHAEWRKRSAVQRLKEALSAPFKPQT
jgi:cardiolipin synthase